MPNLNPSTKSIFSDTTPNILSTAVSDTSTVSPPIIQRTSLMATPAPVAPAISTPVLTVVSPTVSAPMLGATPITTPNNPANTAAKNQLPVISGAAVNNTSIPIQPIAPVQSDTDTSFWDNIKSYIGLDATKGSETTKLQDKYDLAGKAQAVADATNDYNKTKQGYDQQIYTLQTTNPEGKFGGALQKEVATLTFTRDQHLANLAIIKSAADNDLATVNSIVDTKIKAQFDPIEATIKNLEDYAEANPNISKKDEAAIQAQVDNKKGVMDAYSTVVKNVAANAPADQKVSLLNALDQAIQDPNATQATIYAAAGDYGGAAKFTSTTDAYGNPIAFDAVSGTYKYPDGSSANPGTGSSSGNGQAIVDTTLQLIGGNITGDMSVSDAISSVGLPAIINGLVQQEGGTPQGTNNPGNIKFANQPGATKGKAASDGGNFANFATPRDFQNAISTLVKKNGTNSMSDFIASYKGVKVPSYKQYGLLANTNFDPTDPTDQLSYQYLQKYLTSGSIPTASTLGRNIKPGMFGAITTRAGDLYTEATGQPMPNPDIVQSNIKLIQTNNKLLNNIGVQSSTIGKNFALAVSNLDANNINDHVQPINSFLDSVKSMLGDPTISQYFAQNATLSNEVSSLLAVKNASGTTVHDKLESAGLINNKMTAKQEVEVIKTILQEAQNAEDAINGQNASLYQQIDPLQTNTNNPNRQKQTVLVNGNPLVVGSVYTNDKGQQGRINADGSVTPL